MTNIEIVKEKYDLKDYVYKDKRLFPSRVYDEYKACFELFDYVMNGALFDLSKGCYDYYDNEYIFPAQKINCKCDFKPVIFEMGDDIESLMRNKRQKPI